MQVESHNGLREPRSFQATRLVIRDELGNPVVIVAELVGSVITVLKVRDKGFAELCKLLGIDSDVKVTTINPADLTIRI